MKPARSTFINGKQVVDLGGIHLPEEVTVNLDEQAARLGLERGQSYELDFFFAERHLTMSNFRIDTTFFFTDCTIIIPEDARAGRERHRRPGPYETSHAFRVVRVADGGAQPRV